MTLGPGSHSPTSNLQPPTMNPQVRDGALVDLGVRLEDKPDGEAEGGTKTPPIA